MPSSLSGRREVPVSRYDLSTYWGRVRHAADISDPRTLLVPAAQLEQSKTLLAEYRDGHRETMTPELWRAKKIVDSTLHPDTGQPVLLPFRMSSFVLSNLVVTAGMLNPNMGTFGTVAWQITNQSLNVAINSANANKSSPLTTSALVRSYFAAVGASCTVAVGLKSLVPRLTFMPASVRLLLGRLVPFAAVASAGALNVFLMRWDEIRTGIDVYPTAATLSEQSGRREKVPGTGDPRTAEKVVKSSQAAAAAPTSSLPTTDAVVEDVAGRSAAVGKSKIAAKMAVTETALSRVFNATPVMAVPPLLLLRLQRMHWLKSRPRLVLPVNLGLILTTSVFALPFALAVFPQQQAVPARNLEREFWDAGGEDGMLQFNRGI